MKVLAWLAFPLVATLLAMCWAAWRGRSRGPRRSGGAFASVEDFGLVESPLCVVLAQALTTSAATRTAISPPAMRAMLRNFIEPFSVVMDSSGSVQRCDPAYAGFRP